MYVAFSSQTFIPRSHLFILAWTQFTFRGGIRNSAATGYLDDSTRQRKNLVIVVNAEGKRVKPSTSKKGEDQGVHGYTSLFDEITRKKRGGSGDDDMAGALSK